MAWRLRLPVAREHPLTEQPGSVAARSRIMHRELIGQRVERIRGLCSKRFVAELRDQGMEREEVIEAVSRAFCVPRGAAQLFVLSHPSWAEDEARRSWPWWRGGRG